MSKSNTPGIGAAWGAGACQKMVSPNEVQQKAIEVMLDGREPSTEDDWMLIVNFWAFNIGQGLEEAACRLLARIYGCPLSEWQIIEIAQFQLDKKVRMN